MKLPDEIWWRRTTRPSRVTTTKANAASAQSLRELLRTRSLMALGPLAIFVSCLIATGCTPVQIVNSQNAADPGTAGTAEPGGLVYFLPQTLVQIVATQDKDTKVVTYTPSAMIVPDPRAKYRARFTPSPDADNVVDLKVDANGLLTSTSANITDRTGDIITALAKTVASAIPPPAAAPVAKGPEQPAQYPFTQVFFVDSVLGECLELYDRAQIKFELAIPKSDSTTAPMPCPAKAANTSPNTPRLPSQH